MKAQVGLEVVDLRALICEGVRFSLSGLSFLGAGEENRVTGLAQMGEKEEVKGKGF